MVVRIVLFNSPIPLCTVHLAWLCVWRKGEQPGDRVCALSPGESTLIPEEVSDLYPFNGIDLDFKFI